MAIETVRDGYVQAGGVRTHYSSAGGEGPAVVLLHEAGPGVSGGSAWSHVLPALAAGGYRAFAPDQLSMGYTDARPHAWPVLGLQSLVNHVGDFIDALCLDEVSVVGSSQGAYVAAKYALDHPERVSTAFFIGSGTVGAAMGLEQVPTPAWEPVLRYDYTYEAMYSYLLSTVFDRTKITDELVAERHAAANLPGIKQAREAFTAYQARIASEPKLRMRFRLDATLPRLSIPARFLWGKMDPFAPVEMAYQMEQLLPDIGFDFLDDCGHLCHFEQPDLVNAALLEFLAENLQV